MRLRSPFGIVAGLGTAQTLAWASSYYLPAMLALPMARELQMAPATVFAAFSLALVVAAFVGPSAGRAVDRYGGRAVLSATSGVFATGLFLLGSAQSPAGLFLAWSVMGVGMGSGLYEAAFAALVRLQGQAARPPITGITLIAGFASTVGWPLSAYLEATFDWRGACFAWAALHLLIGLPLNASLPGTTAPAADADADPPRAAPRPSRSTLAAGPAQRRVGWQLAIVFAITWFVSTAIAVHLPRLLQAGGASLAAAVAAAALVGPAQVAARLLEFGLLRRVHPLHSARLAALAHPLGAAALLLAGMGPLFTVLHGAGNGILTIAKGTLPLVLFGAEGYGHRQGLLMVPARIAQALAPFLFGLLVDRWGTGALWLSVGLSLAAYALLCNIGRATPVPNNEAALAAPD